MYNTLIMLDPDSQVAPEMLRVELERLYSSTPGNRPTIAANAGTMKLKWPDYTLDLSYSRLPHVIEESAEIALEYGSLHPAGQRIALCHTRYEMSGEDDPDMSYFNDHLYVIEAIQRLGTAYAFNTETCEFI